VKSQTLSRNRGTLSGRRPDRAGWLQLTRRSDPSSHPLSFAQERIWFLWQLEPDAPVYNRPAFLRLTGTLNHKALEEALNALRRRHEILRAAFPAENGKPAQVIQAWQHEPLFCEDLSHLPCDAREEELRRRSLAAAQQPFDLVRGPVMRAHLLGLDQEDHMLLLVFHHIVFDAWSGRLLPGEIARLYERVGDGELPIQYADYAAWQRRCHDEGFWDGELEYWRKELSGDLPVTDLPVAGPRPALSSYRGATWSLTLPQHLVADLSTLYREARASLFMLLLAAFDVLLYRYSGENDIIVGCPIAGRTRLETEPLLGCFINTLALRAQIKGELSFRELLGQVREKALAAYQYQNVPFEKIVEVINPPRILNRTPVFQILFNMRNLPRANLANDKSDNLRITPWHCDDGIAQFDLSLDVSEDEGSFSCLWKYRRDLFRREDVQRMAECYERLLCSIVANPEQRISRLPILPETERDKIVMEWNRTTKDFPREANIDHLFEEQVAGVPQTVAVEFQGERLTYSELNARANQLAQHLRTFQIPRSATAATGSQGPDAVVGLCVERSVEMVVGILGTLKAGAAYMPLDPNYPAKRLAFMIADAGARVILTLSGLKKVVSDAIADLEERLAPVVICLDQLDSIRESDSSPEVCATAESLACVLYTSGSTGRPKGVEITHRGIARLVKGADYISLGSGEVFLQMAPLAFDASTFEIWGALLNGAKLVVMPPGIPTLEEIGRAIQLSGVTTLFLTTGLFHLMVEERLEDLKPLRQLLTGGDVLSVTHAQRARRELKNCRLVNLYGPTECTTVASAFEIGEMDGSRSSVPIGRPIANTQLYILDEELQPLPIGVEGELYIGGDGLARGYLNQAELTAEKFIPNPFMGETGARIYRTGDRARYLPDGEVEFLGRLDDQVKIRGFRVEVGEIEAALARHPNVRQAAVAATETTPRSLVAFVVARGENVAEELREFLKQTLPDYMLPAGFVFLKSLPLTSTGKRDRQALSNWSLAEHRDDKQFVAPRTNLESQIAEIWQRALRLPAISVSDNFFDRGGHSLLAVRLVSEINRTLGVDLRILTLFQNPTIAQLARTIELQKSGRRMPAIRTLRSGRSDVPLFFIDPTPAEFRLANLLPGEPAIFGTEVPLPLDVLQAASMNAGLLPPLETFATEHARLILHHHPTGECLIAGYSFTGVLAFEVARQLQRAGRKVRAVLLFDSALKRLSERRRDWRWFKLWCRRQLRNTLRGGVAYLVRKTVNRLRYEKGRLVFALNPPRVSDGPIPPALTEKIYQTTSRTYRPIQLQTRGVLFRAADNLKNIYAADRSLGWSNLFSEGIAVIDVPGEHTTIMQEPNIGTLAEKVSEVLESKANANAERRTSKAERRTPNGRG
jgi:amino acid adenylation domain-containing protein